jgi:4-amino-4-deoxy-L-arabinose transferase-like glycosyltransferase
MRTLAMFIQWTLVLAFRLAGFLVAGLLLFFPAYKGVWAGYIPLVGGAMVCAVVIRYHRRPLAWVADWKESTFCALLLVLPVLLQLILIFTFQSRPTFDGWFVMREAETLARTGAMSPMTYYAPAQIWYYAFFFKLFAASPVVAQICQIPLVVALVFLSYRFATGVMPRSFARAGALGLSLYPGFLLYILVTPYYYYLYTLAMLLVAWTWIYVARNPACWRAACGGGVVAGWGALTKATLLVAPVQAAFFWLALSGHWLDKKRWMAVFLFALCSSAVLAPWVMRNHAVFGEPVLICTSGPLVFYSANNPASDGMYSPIPDQVDLHTPQEMLEHGRWCKEQAWTFIREQPGAFLRLAASKLLHTWGTETTFVELINWRGDAMGRLDPLLRMIVQVGWAALVFAWLLMAWSALKTRQKPTLPEMATAIVVLSKFLIYTLYEGGARHHLPAVPFLILTVLAYAAAREGARAQQVRE